MSVCMYVCMSVYLYHPCISLNVSRIYQYALYLLAASCNIIYKFFDCPTLPKTLNLPSLLWKPLVHVEPQLADLNGVDASFVSGVLSKIDGLSDTEADEKAFYDHFGERTLFFSVTRSDQTRVALKPGGETEPVSFAQRAEFAELALRARLRESEKQVSMSEEETSTFAEVAL
jgi:hypothetical protein